MPGTIENYIGNEARIVLYEYQRQLREDTPENLSQLRGDHWYWNSGDGLGILGIDTRGPRSWYASNNSSLPFLGEAQWEDIIGWLEGEELSNVRTLYVSSPVTPAAIGYFIVNGLTKFGNWLDSPYLDDLEGIWVYFSKELVKILDLMRAWKDRKKGREVIFVSGDVHMALNSRILDGSTGETIFHSFSTSPISNYPTNGKYAFAALLASYIDPYLDNIGAYKFKNDAVTVIVVCIFFQVAH